MQQNASNPFARGTKLIKLQVGTHVARVESGYQTQEDYDSQRSLNEQVQSLKAELEVARGELLVDCEVLRIVRKMETDLKGTAEALYLRVPSELSLRI